MNITRIILRKWRSAEKELIALRKEHKQIVDEIDALRELSVKAPDGMPHGTGISNPTEERAIRIVDQMKARRKRLDEIFYRIEADERLLDRINFAMVLAKNSELLRRYYHDRVPMQKVASEFFVSVRKAWYMEREGIDSIKDLL
jgi:hypothetical protein